MALGLQSRKRARARPAAGASAIDLMVVAAIALVVAVTTLPLFGRARARWEGEAAARFLLHLFRSARVLAARRAEVVGVRAETLSGGTAFRLYADGDGDGVGLADIAAGVDRPLAPERWLSDDFPHVPVVIRRALPEIDGSGTLAAGADPTRLGANDVLSFAPDGSSSGGTVYLEGPDGTPYAVRVLSTTGRARVLRFHGSSGAWEER